MSQFVLFLHVIPDRLAVVRLLVQTKISLIITIACLQSRDSIDVRNSDGGQEVKSRMDEML